MVEVELGHEVEAEVQSSGETSFLLFGYVMKMFEVELGLKSQPKPSSKHVVKLEDQSSGETSFLLFGYENLLVVCSFHFVHFTLSKPCFNQFALVFQFSGGLWI